MIPGSAAGTMTVKAARARVAPRASDPSRRRPGHEVEQLLRRPRDDRNHHEAEGDSARERREVLDGQHDEPVREDPDHDRGDPVQDVRREPDERSRTSRLPYSDR